MDVVYRSCCGLDVHHKTVVACRRIMRKDGKLDQQVRTFDTMTEDR